MGFFDNITDGIKKRAINIVNDVVITTKFHLSINKANELKNRFVSEKKNLMSMKNIFSLLREDKKIEDYNELIKNLDSGFAKVEKLSQNYEAISKNGGQIDEGIFDRDAVIVDECENILKSIIEKKAVLFMAYKTRLEKNIKKIKNEINIINNILGYEKDQYVDKQLNAQVEICKKKINDIEKRIKRIDKNNYEYLNISDALYAEIKKDFSNTNAVIKYAQKSRNDYLVDKIENLKKDLSYELGKLKELSEDNKYDMWGEEIEGLRNICLNHIKNLDEIKEMILVKGTAIKANEYDGSFNRVKQIVRDIDGCVLKRQAFLNPDNCERQRRKKMFENLPDEMRELRLDGELTNEIIRNWHTLNQIYKPNKSKENDLNLGAQPMDNGLSIGRSNAVYGRGASRSN